jgi:hypothetical protein
VYCVFQRGSCPEYKGVNPHASTNALLLVSLRENRKINNRERQKVQGPGSELAGREGQDRVRVGQGIDQRGQVNIHVQQMANVKSSPESSQVPRPFYILNGWKKLYKIGPRTLIKSHAAQKHIFNNTVLS